jgi:hypothetical protein
MSARYLIEVDYRFLFGSSRHSFSASDHMSDRRAKTRWSSHAAAAGQHSDNDEQESFPHGYGSENSARFGLK